MNHISFVECQCFKFRFSLLLPDFSDQICFWVDIWYQWYLKNSTETSHISLLKYTSNDILIFSQYFQSMLSFQSARVCTTLILLISYIFLCFDCCFFIFSFQFHFLFSPLILFSPFSFGFILWLLLSFSFPILSIHCKYPF